MYQLKIFGERNCGTNLLTQTAETDGRFRILPGTAPASIRRITSRLPHKTKEALLDAVDSRRRIRTLGWKHAWPDDYVASQLDERSVLAVAAIRHPLSWCVSLRARPYQLRELGNGQLNVMRIAREHLPRDTKSYRDIWLLKATRYLELQDRGVLRLLQFEALIEDPAHELLGAIDLSSSDGGHAAAPTTSVKGDGRSRADILDYYRIEAWRQDVTKQDLDWAHSLPAGLLAALEYDV